MTELSDNKFSVDDILNEYSKKKEQKSKSKSTFNVDEFFASSQVSVNENKKKSFDFNINDNNSGFAPENNANKATTPLPENNINEKTNLKSENNISDNINSKENALKPLRRNSGNTEIIESILKMKKERIFSKTAEIVPINRKNINDINLEITDKIIPKTEQIPIGSIIDEDAKMQMLEEKRSKRIKDFVLTNTKSLDTDSLFEEESDDFSEIDDAPEIADEISQLKGNIIVRIIFLAIASIISTYTAFANDFAWPVVDLFSITQNPQSYLFINIVIGFLTVFVSSSVIVSGIKNLFKLNADCDSICSIGIIGSLISAVLILFNSQQLQQGTVHIFICVSILSLLFNSIGRLLIINRTELNFKYISGDNEKHGLFQIEDQDTASRFTRGSVSGFPSLTSMKKTEFINDFLKTSFNPDISDAFCKKAVPITLISSLVIALLSLFFNTSLDISARLVIAVSVFSGTTALASCFAIMFVTNLPLARATKQLLLSSACMISYQAVEEFSDTNSVLLDVSQLFPEGSVELVNLKQISSSTIEEGILIAASLSCHANSILKPTFYKMLKGKIEMLYPVESYLYEDTLGLSGWISNKRVLLGTRELMKNHSIEGLPSLAKEVDYAKGNLVLYLSVSGEITTMFIIKIKASLGVAKWLKELSNQRITVILRSVDSIISLTFLSDVFKVPSETFKLIPFRHHKKFDELTTFEPQVSTPLVCSGKFQSFAMLISTIRKIAKTSVFGVSFAVASLCTGLLLSLTMALLSSYSELTASVIILINLAWAVITYLAISIKRF